MPIYPNSMKNVNRHHEGDLVDIIMRTKDRALLLRRALNSVLNQSYQNWHLYIVNDGGNETQLKNLLIPYKKRLKNRVSIINNEKSLGRKAASNCALKQSKGNFLVVHDDDDTWHQNFLMRTTEFLKDKKNASFAAVSTNTKMIIEVIVKDKIVMVDEKPFTRHKHVIDYLDLLSTNSITNLSFLIRKAAVEKAGFFNEAMPVGGDWDYNIRILQVGDIGTIDEDLAHYHIRVNSDQQPDYSNTLTAGVSTHIELQTYYLNSLMRHTLSQHEDLIGVFSAMSEVEEAMLLRLKALINHP